MASLAYDFVAPWQVVFGWGRRKEVGRLAGQLGRRAFVLCGAEALRANGEVDAIAARLRQAGVAAEFIETLTNEPEVADVDRVAGRLADMQAGHGDLMLAIGGGATIDLAKASGALAVNRQSPTVADYLEGVGRGLRLQVDPLPVLAMPTTAGTGAEATKNAVISSYSPAFKKSLRDERLLPRIALVDPELAVSLPPAVTAASGMDAITQLIESFISRKARPIPQALAKQGLKLAVPAIERCMDDPASQSGREGMAHAALLSGMALANSGLGMAHGVAASLGVLARVPHGAACALLLPVALRANRTVSEQDLAELAHASLGKRSSATAVEAVDFLIDRIDRLCDRVGVPRRLSEVGIRAEQIPAVVAGSRGSSMSGNPRDLSDEELTRMLEAIL